MKFIFNSRYETLTVVLHPTKKLVVGGEVIKEEGLKARFTNGLFETEDPDIAERLRKKIKGDPNVVEITSEDQRAFAVGAKALNQREAATALDMKGEKEKASLTEKVNLVCPICDQRFTAKADYDVHMVSHRAALQKLNKEKVEKKDAVPAVAEKCRHETRRT